MQYKDVEKKIQALHDHIRELSLYVWNGHAAMYRDIGWGSALNTERSATWLQ